MDLCISPKFLRMELLISVLHHEIVQRNLVRIIQIEKIKKLYNSFHINKADR